MSSLAALIGTPEPVSFRRDSRFAPSSPAAPALLPEAPGEDPAEDPLARAFLDGHAAGRAEAMAEAATTAQADSTAHAALGTALARLDAEMAEALRQRLQDTVMALCEATLVPFSLDPPVLAARVERAVAMFSRAEDERVIRLHPEDLALVSSQLKADWQVVPDRSLERGALRVESQSGGVEDGPEQWRRALAEAFHAC